MNAIIIEQDQDETKLAFELIENAAIERIRLARAKAISQGIDEERGAPIEVMFNFKSKPMAAPSSVLRLEIAFRMVGVEERVRGEGKKAPPDKKLDHRKQEPIVLVECAYEVDYILREGFFITPEHIKAFKDGNAIFNAWPYFREYLQNSLQRMGLPPLTAPFLRLRPKSKPRKREKHENEAEGSVMRQNRR